MVLGEAPNLEMMEIESWDALRGVVLLSRKDGGVVVHYFFVHSHDNNFGPFSTVFAFTFAAASGERVSEELDV